MATRDGDAGDRSISEAELTKHAQAAGPRIGCLRVHNKAGYAQLLGASSAKNIYYPTEV